MPFGIVACSFSDNLSRNSCILVRAIMLNNKTSTRYRDAYLKKEMGIIKRSHDTNKREEEEKKSINYLPERKF